MSVAAADSPTGQVDLYERESGTVRREIAGLSSQELAAHPVPGTWSIGEIVTHLCDSELAFAERMKRIIAEDGVPPLQAWDENRWMEKMPVTRGPSEETAQLLELARRQMAWVLRGLSTEAFARAGMHSQAGRMTLLDVLIKANWHQAHHLRFLREKKAMITGVANK